jgi:hypothetical protein
MVILSNYVNNELGAVYTYVGDGTTTTTTVPSRETFRLYHFGFLRFVVRLLLKKMTAKAYVRTGATAFNPVNGQATNGEVVNATAKINPDRTFSVTTTPAVPNGAVASVIVVIDQVPANK